MRRRLPAAGMLKPRRPRYKGLMPESGQTAFELAFCDRPDWPNSGSS
jgi:hypothetical protein